MTKVTVESKNEALCSLGNVLGQCETAYREGSNSRQAIMDIAQITAWRIEAVKALEVVREGGVGS